MTGHLEQLLLSLISVLRRWLGYSEQSDRMIPVRVRSRRAPMDRQSHDSVDTYSRESNALPAWSGGNTDAGLSFDHQPRWGSNPSCHNSQPDDL